MPITVKKKKFPKIPFIMMNLTISAGSKDNFKDLYRGWEVTKSNVYFHVLPSQIYK